MLSPLKIFSIAFPTTSRAFVCRRMFSSSSSEAARQKKLEELFPSNQIDPSKTQKWQILVSVVLERYPVIAPAPTDLEVRYQKMLRTLEDEQSLLSYHELRKQEE